MSDISRRAAFQASGAIAVAAAFAGTAQGAEPSAAEGANLKVARSYFMEFAKPGADVAKVLQAHMAEDVVVRYTETTPPVMGLPKLTESLKGFTMAGRQYEIAILD